MTNISLQGIYQVRYMGNDCNEFDRLIAIMSSDKSFSFNNGDWIITGTTLDLILNKHSILDLEYSLNSNIAIENDIGSDLKFSLFPYQKDVVSFCLDKGKSIIVLPCGAGKTPIGIDIFIDAKKRGLISKDSKGLIVVKSSLKVQWSKEIEKFSYLKASIINTKASCSTYKQNKLSKLKKQMDKLLLKSSENISKIEALDKEMTNLQENIDDDFNKMFSNDYDIFIANYETLRDESVKKKLHKSNIEYIFADEVHYIKNDTSARSKALCEFSDIKIRFGATATPIQKNPLDAYSIAKFISPGLFKSKTAFSQRYLNFSGWGRVSGSKNEKELNQKLNDFMIVKKKEEVSSQLPSLVPIIRYCQLDSKQKEMTERLLSEIQELKEEEKKLQCASSNLRKYTNELHIPDNGMVSDELLKIQANIMARQTFASEIATTEELLMNSESDLAKHYVTGSKSSKIELLLDLLEEIIESGEKVAIFSKYRKLQDILDREILKKFPDISIAKANGTLSSQDRYKEVYTKFQGDEKCKVLLLSDALAEGVNISTCKYLIEMEPADSYLIQTQRRGRIERADSIHDTVFVYQLIAQDSYDEIGLKIIEKKERYDAQIIKGDV